MNIKFMCTILGARQGLRMLQMHKQLETFDMCRSRRLPPKSTAWPEADSIYPGLHQLICLRGPISVG